uniref:Uncharacterized protein n=1 Tax=Rhizophora mucronata TaxID=61149 RepID=A0A2P2PSV0_RHIMU
MNVTSDQESLDEETTSYKHNKIAD